MLKDFQRKKSEDKDALNAEIKETREKLLAQQQLIRDNKLPVLVLIEGWAAAGKGTLIKELISEIDPRFYNVSSPAVVPESEERYPVLYMFDGHNVFYDSHATYGRSWGMKEYLEKTKLPLILVAVECNHEGNRRLSEYAPWDFSAGRLGQFEGQGRLTMDWLSKELKPEIDSSFRTLPEREDTLIAGSSRGGLMAIYAAVAYNGVFSRAAALSPSLWVCRKNLGELIRSQKLASPTRVYLDYGGGEAAQRSSWHMPETVFRTAGLLTAAGADVAARVVPGAMHCEADWEKRIPVFMDYLLG